MGGIFGAYNKDNLVSPLIYWGLRAQNHRGHQSHGIITYNGECFYTYKGLGIVPAMKEKGLVDKLPGCIGIGNVKYATSRSIDEESLIKNAEPFLLESKNRKIAISFNGSIVNVKELEEDIKKMVPNFSYRSDVQLLITKLFLEFDKGLEYSVKNCMECVEGGFSVVGITNNKELLAFKDPYGIRPLCMGYSEDDKTYAFSSEKVGLDINGLLMDSEIEPGELVIVSDDGLRKEKLVKGDRKAFCAFEFAYFARPDSKFGEKYVYEIREEFGRNLVEENSDIVKRADIILSMPETAEDAAFGASERSGLRWEKAARRHRYITERAFILPERERYSTISKKINIIPEKVRGKKLIVIDDSIVRGDTTKTTVKNLRKMGAIEIHLLITFPQIRYPCFYGIDMATYEELIGSFHEPAEIARIIGADTVNYQSIDGFIRATGFRRDELCLACVNGEYPTPFAQKISREAREKLEKGIKIYES